MRGKGAAGKKKMKTARRQVQSTITNFYAPITPDQPKIQGTEPKPRQDTTDQPVANRRCQMDSLAVRAIIYAYFHKARPDVYVYVGQTRQAMETRDSQHRYANVTRFDQELMKNGELYQYKILKERTFTTMVQGSWTEQDVLREQSRLVGEATVWMNREEKKAICDHDTNRNGFNCTAGNRGATREGVMAIGIAWRKKQLAQANKIVDLFRSVGNEEESHKINGKIIFLGGEIKRIYRKTTYTTKAGDVVNIGGMFAGMRTHLKHRGTHFGLNLRWWQEKVKGIFHRSV